jgi:hypothetical protein
MSIPFTHYIAGIRSGIYPAFSKPTFSKSNSLQDIVYDEYQREWARASVKKLIYGSSSNRYKSEFRTPFLHYFFPGSLFLPSSSQSNNSQNSNQTPRLNSDEVFGLVEELCHKCGIFKEIRISFDKSRVGEIRQNHASCATSNVRTKYRDIVLSNPALQKDMSSIFLKPRIENWTFGHPGIIVFPLGEEATRITICMGADKNRCVTILPTKNSIVKLNEPDLNFYDWLKDALGSIWCSALVEEDMDPFIYLAGNKTWFFLKLINGYRQSQRCYFVMLINHRVNYVPEMLDWVDL